MRTNGPQATLGESEQKAIVRERAACRLEPARTQPCRRRHQLRARSPWLVLRRGPSEAIFPQPLLDSSHRARRRLITHPCHSARRSGRPSGSFCVELGVDLCLHAPDLVQTWAGVTRQHPCSERRAHRSISRNSRSATIAADVKRFCHQIKSDDVFGTHRSAPSLRASSRSRRFGCSCSRPSTGRQANFEQGHAACPVKRPGDSRTPQYGTSCPSAYWPLVLHRLPARHCVL